MQPLRPTTDAFVSALKKLYPLAEHHDKMLSAHFRSEGHTLTATKLADAMNYADYHAVNLHYGKFANLLCDQLGLLHEFGIMLDSAEPNDENGHLDLVMRSELVDAIARLGWYS